MDVFIVHAMAERKKTSKIVEFINEFGHTPILMENIKSCGDLTQKFLKSAKTCKKAVILYTLNNKVYVSKNAPLKKVARENVVFELGYFVAKLGFKNLLIIRSNSTKKDMPSDIGNIETIPFSTSKKSIFYRKLKELVS